MNWHTDHVTRKPEVTFTIADPRITPVTPALESLPNLETYEYYRFAIRGGVPLESETPEGPMILTAGRKCREQHNGRCWVIVAAFLNGSRFLKRSFSMIGSS